MRRLDTIFSLITLLITNKLMCDGILIANTDSSGFSRGDPAPGRSPGPPSGDKYKSRSSSFHRDITDEKEERCSWEEDGVHHLATSDDKTNVTTVVSHRLFNTDVLVFEMVYQVTIRQLRVQKPATNGEYIISSTIRGLPKGNFHPTATGRSSSCPEHVHKGQFFEYASVVLNWTMEETRQFNGSNVTFTLKYKTDSRPVIYEAVYEIPIIQDCQLWLKNESGEEIGSWHFPRRRDCLCWFPGPSSDHGLVIDVTRLNVPCARGDYLYFSGLNISSSSSPYQQQQHIRGHRQTHICGKLEELPLSDRRVYFPPSHTPPFLRLHGDPVFAFNYRLVDFCYNVTFTSRNGSFDLGSPKANLRCTFKIYLPYGHRIALTLIVSGVSERIHSDQNKDEESKIKEEQEEEEISDECSGGLRFELQDGNGGIRSHCTRAGDAERRVEFVSHENKLVLKIWSISNHLGGSASLSSSSLAFPSLKMKYRAEPIEELTRTCDFGWIVHRQFCLIAIEEMRLPWMQAEMECGRRGGHLASVRNGDTQEIINRMLLNRSPLI
ncbi:hypothetical protein AMK59_2254 [Oryctes borbonicus]|uniref:C-type lectin n=1 Tax=Oryctes borbonicus TaxID=1629725 RepID=A0A0T6BCV5_9SCAR|nr:hypothetical protein AMK59_2254 [Oryctes borbonicus]